MSLKESPVTSKLLICIVENCNINVSGTNPANQTLHLTNVFVVYFLMVCLSFCKHSTNVEMTGVTERIQ